MIDQATMTQNIVNAWNDLSDEDIAKGHAWYPVAHDIAIMLGHGDARIGAGIIAALSPLKSWSENIRLATDAGNGNVHGHFAANMRKVNMIMAGSDPADVLPMDAKTGNFFANIANPSDPYAVTIDRHAFKIATGDDSHTPMPKLTPKQYQRVADAYRNAGRILGELASVVQAAVWGPRARAGY